MHSWGLIAWWITWIRWCHCNRIFWYSYRWCGWGISTWVPLWYTDGEVIGTDDGIILVSNDCEPIGSAFGAGDGITLGIDEIKEMCTMPMMCGLLSVCVFIWVVLNSTCSEYYD